MDQTPNHREESSIVWEFLKFIRKPNTRFATQTFSGKSILQCTYLYFIVFFLSMLLVIPVFSLIHIDRIPHQMEDFMDRFAPWKAILIIAIAAPIVEETIFRFPLKYPFLSVCLIQFGLLAGLYFLVDSFFSIGNLPGLMIIAGSVLIFLNILLAIFQYSRLRSFHEMYFPFVFYFIVILFSLAHIFNFEIGLVHWYFIPLLVFPQLVLAIVLGFLRLKIGMWANIYIHALNNLWPLAMIYFVNPTQTG